MPMSREVYWARRPSTPFRFRALLSGTTYALLAAVGDVHDLNCIPVLHRTCEIKLS